MKRNKTIKFRYSYIINELICINLLNTKIEYENGKHFSGKYGRVRELVTGTLLLDSDMPIPFFADTDFCIVYTLACRFLFLC